MIMGRDIVLLGKLREMMKGMGRGRWRGMRELELRRE
jgi:hypothetical protein